MGAKVLKELRKRLSGLDTNAMKAVAAKTRPHVSWQAIYKISRGDTADPGILTVERIQRALEADRR